MLRIGLFGSTGQLGQMLFQDLVKIATVIAPTRSQLDLTQQHAVHQWLLQHPCDVLVNAAAMTQVDAAEAEPELSRLLNTQFVQQLADYAALKKMWFIHFSTDYVFDGSGDRPWQESDDCFPLQQYGHSKRLGELAIIRSGCAHLIFRTSWLYHHQGQNFLLTMLKLARQSTSKIQQCTSPTMPLKQAMPFNDVLPLNIVADQVGAPTYAPELSRAVTSILKQLLQMPDKQAYNLSGVYHLCASGFCSWFEFATAIFDYAVDTGLIDHRPLLLPITSEELQRAAKRPKNSRFDTHKVQTLFVLELSSWQDQLKQCLNVLKSSDETSKQSIS